MGKEVVGQRRSARLIARKSKSFMGCICHKTIEGKGLLRAVNMDVKGKGLKVVGNNPIKKGEIIAYGEGTLFLPAYQQSLQSIAYIIEFNSSGSPVDPCTHLLCC